MTPILDAEVPTQSSTPHNAEVDQTNKVYLLPSDEVEKERLAIQHSIILEGTGGKLVHAPVTLDEKSSVLESATGSGIWLQDLAKIVPTTTELVGIDIQSKTFPQPSALPPNMQFRVQSVVDLPKEWTNKFDFVHQRLLCLGLRDADWHRALGEIYRVLKPGGWFQWLEIDNLEQMGPTMKIFSHLLQRTADLRGMEGSWPNGSIKWQRFLEEAGFVNIRITWHYAPIGGWAGEKGILGKKNIVQVYRSTNKAAIEFGLVDEEESDKLFQELDKEIDSSSGLRNVYVMLCAQKAAE